MPEYNVKYPVRIKGVKHPEGSTVTLSENRAKEMVDRGVLTLVDKNPPVAMEDIVKAIGNLPIDDKESWTNDGPPQVKALGDILDQTISAKERDEAWKLYQDSQEK